MTNFAKIMTKPNDILNLHLKINRKQIILDARLYAVDLNKTITKSKLNRFKKFNFTRLELSYYLDTKH